MAYSNTTAGPYKPAVRRIEIRDCRFASVKQALSLVGLSEEAKVADITLENCTFDSAAAPNTVHFVDGLKMVNVTINGTPQK
jgi:polygalacturonase